MLKINKTTKSLISLVIILITLFLVVYFLDNHKNLINKFLNISPLLLIEVFILYFVMLIVLVLIFKFTMKLNNIDLHFKNNLFLNMVSLFMNFFIPGQSGPIYRAYYMKTEHKLKIRQFSLSTLIYFGIYAVIAVLFIGFGVFNVYLFILSLVILSLGSYLFLRYYLKKKNADFKIHLNTLFKLAVVTLFQFIVQFVIYYLEIHSIKKNLPLKDVISYTGTAGLALFVALTPGAIGIRESFLLLTEKINHLNSSTIVFANLIDRSIYIAFLLVIGILIVIFHINKKINIKKQNSLEVIK